MVAPGGTGEAKLTPPPRPSPFGPLLSPQVKEEHIPFPAPNAVALFCKFSLERFFLLTALPA